MKIKNYSELSPTSCASLIIRDIITEGSSKGWTGNEQDLQPLKKILNHFHLKVIPDSQGMYRFENRMEESL